MEEYKLGIFKEECRNRFLCKIQIEEDIEECYLSSSCKLGHFIDLKDKRVLLKSNKGKKLRTSYTLQALWEKNKKILLNLNYINDLVADELYRDKIEKNIIKREHWVNKKIKTDFYNDLTKEVVEVKGILTEKSSALFPSIKTERAVNQLKEYKKLLKKGYKIKYIIVLMNDKIEKLYLNNDEKEFCKLFKACKKLGMSCEFYGVKWNKYTPILLKKEGFIIE